MLKEWKAVCVTGAEPVGWTDEMEEGPHPCGRERDSWRAGLSDCDVSDGCMANIYCLCSMYLLFPTPNFIFACCSQRSLTFDAITTLIVPFANYCLT